MVFLIYCTSCKKCTQSELVNLKFTTEDLNVNPYSQNEWLVFKNLSGDSIIFLHGKRATDSFTYYQYPDNQYDHGCTGNYYIMETDQTDFYTSSGSSSPYLGIKLGFNYSFNDPTLGKFIYLEFFSPTVGISGFYGFYSFEKDSIFNLPPKYDTIVKKHNQITIGRRSFTNVYELYALNREKINNEWFSNAYYSIDEGFCGFKTNSGIIWYLDRKMK